MRKADYAALADTIKARREWHLALMDGATPMRHYAHKTCADELEVLAHVLASKLSVDAALFRKACGLS